MKTLTASVLSPRHLGLLGLAIGVPLAAIVLFLGGGSGSRASVEHAVRSTTPTAAEFTGKFVGVSNAYASEHGSRSRIARAHCVQAARGQYMCAYSVLKPDEKPTCHLMQARWTPQAADSFTITLSGRAGRCGSIREAVRSLR